MNSYHIPVLLEETIKYLSVLKGNKYIDGTFGGGGHTREILAAGGQVLALDQDQEAIEEAKKNFSQEIMNSTLTIKKANFSDLKAVCQTTGFQPVSGVVLDLGVSSHQLDTGHRGFSFNKDAHLDMRMDPQNQGVTAADFINAAGESELTSIFWRFGGENMSRKIAKAVVQARKSGRIDTTLQLANIVSSVKPRSLSGSIHPATKVFQALRIAVNDELNSLTSVLPQTLDVLEPSGRLVVISFHELEDKIVKTFFREHENELEELSEKPIVPTEAETSRNPRSRSAKLRAARKR
jgi:16S rRNA (cytosine1402-N4)-methyltransferase